MLLESLLRCTLPPLEEDGAVRLGYGQRAALFDTDGFDLRLFAQALRSRLRSSLSSRRGGSGSALVGSALERAVAALSESAERRLHVLYISSLQELRDGLDSLPALSAAWTAASSAAAGAVAASSNTATDDCRLGVVAVDSLSRLKWNSHVARSLRSGGGCGGGGHYEATSHNLGVDLEAQIQSRLASLRSSLSLCSIVASAPPRTHARGELFSSMPTHAPPICLCLRRRPSKPGQPTAVEVLLHSRWGVKGYGVARPTTRVLEAHLCDRSHGVRILKTNASSKDDRHEYKGLKPG